MPGAARTGSATAAGTILTVLGVLGLGVFGWLAFDALKVKGQVAELEAFLNADLGGTNLLIVAVVSFLGLIGAILTLIGGIRVLGRSAAGATLGMVGSIVLLAAVAGYIVTAMMFDFPPRPLEWAGLAVVGLGSIAGIILAAMSRRRLAPATLAPWGG